MTHIEGEIVIERPVEEVFDFVADERNEPRYNPRMLVAEKETPGPIGAGTRFRAVVATGRRPIEMSVELTAYERPSLLASVTCLPSMEIAGSLRFDSVAEGTRMRWSWEVAPKGAYKLLTPVVGRVGRRQERAIWSELKRLEGASSEGPPVGDPRSSAV